MQRTKQPYAKCAWARQRGATRQMRARAGDYTPNACPDGLDAPNARREDASNRRHAKRMPELPGRAKCAPRGRREEEEDDDKCIFPAKTHKPCNAYHKYSSSPHPVGLESLMLKACHLSLSRSVSIKASELGKHEEAIDNNSAAHSLFGLPRARLQVSVTGMRVSD